MAVLAMATMRCTISLGAIRNRTSSRVIVIRTYESLKSSFYLPFAGRLIVFAIAASPIPLESLYPVAGLTAPGEPF